MTRRIALATGNRADFGHLSLLAKRLANDPEIEFQLLVTGSHLADSHGRTVSEIIAEGFSPAAEIAIPIADDTGSALGNAIGNVTSQFAEAFARLAPELVVILGDRYEMLGVATAALISKVPVVHIHGGETTYGAMDESIRHAISKMASLHFVAAEPFRQRLIRMGEQPERVFCLGAPVIERIKSTKLLTRNDLEQSLSFDLSAPLAVVTMHPATRSLVGAQAEVEALVAALKRSENLRIVMTATNPDPGSRAVAGALESFAASARDRVLAVNSLGFLRYVSLLACADVMIGNSSSGYIEAPVFGLPVIDIGDRQLGRAAARCIQRVGADADAICSALTHALDPDWRRIAAKGEHPYGTGDFSHGALDVLKSTATGPELLQKSFYDGTPS